MLAFIGVGTGGGGGGGGGGGEDHGPPQPGAQVGGVAVTWIVACLVNSLEIQFQC